MTASDFCSGDPSGFSPLVIIGAGGHAVSVANVAISAGYAIECFVDESKQGSNVLGYSVIGNISALDNVYARSYAIAIGDNALRERVYGDLLALWPELEFPPLVHQSASISPFAEVGPGTVVMPQAVIGPASRVGRFCILNTRASLDHDCVMQDFSSLAPGAVTGGNVNIGFRSAVSIGAVIKHGITVGVDSVLGANSYLDDELPDNRVAYGSPARIIRSRNTGDAYLK